MIFGKYPISTTCQKRGGNSDRKEVKNRDKNSDVWTNIRRDRDMGYQEEWRRYEKGLKERKEGSTAILRPFWEKVNFLSFQEKKMFLEPKVRLLQWF